MGFGRAVFVATARYKAFELVLILLAGNAGYTCSLPQTVLDLRRPADNAE